MRHALLVLLLAPLCAQEGEQPPAAQPVAPKSAIQDPAAQPPVDFTKEIAPIFVARCIECHGPDKQKGDLRLDAREHLFIAGEEDYWAVVPKQPDASELVHRLGLPADDEEVMPNKGEPLTKAQQELIARWVREGAVWPPAGDEWIQQELAAQVLPMITFDLPALDDAAQQQVAKAVEALRGKGAVVQPVAADTQAIEVNLSLLRDQVTDETLALLRPLAPVLVWLNASRTKVGDAGAAHLAALTQLRRLNLANTAMTDAGFRQLATLQQLEHLNAYGTGLGDEGLAKLAALPKLQRLYAWQSKVSKDGVAAIREHAAKVEVDLGDYVEERLAAAQKEIDEREQRNKPVNEKCPVTGEPIDAAQVVEHDGRRIAFCCAKCKAKFEADPAAFADKVVPAGEQGGAGKGADKKGKGEAKGK